MGETMYNCYVSQFDCWRSIIENRKIILGQAIDLLREIAPERIYLIGSGSSFNACGASKTFVQKMLGIEITPIAPSKVQTIFGEKVLGLAVSQSGRSTNTLRAMRKFQKNGFPVIALTDDMNSPVAKAGDLAVHLAAQQEMVGPKTRGYTSTILTLYLLALEVALDWGRISIDKYSSAIAAYLKICDEKQAYLEACHDFYDLHFDNLKKARAFLFSGKDTDAMTANESALKVLETLCFPAIGYEFEEFLHGPLCCIDENVAVFFFLAQDEDKQRMLQTAEILGKITPNCYVITCDSQFKNDSILSLPASEASESTAFTYVLFSQLISAKLTEELGRKRHPGIQQVFEKLGTKTS